MIQKLQDKRRQDGQGGFTLIELLVVITILGILSAVVVFSVAGISNTGQDSACQIDKRTLQTAMEAYRANNTGYVVGASGDTAETALMNAGFLSSVSSYYNIVSPGTVNTTSYDVVGQTTGVNAGKCS